MKQHFQTTDVRGSEEGKLEAANDGVGLRKLRPSAAISERLSPVSVSIRGSKNSGAALLIALTFLVLLSAVVLALFASSRTDRQNAAAFSNGQETLRLAETAVNLVQGQIRDATIQSRVGWASQPGMIRTFDQTGITTASTVLKEEAKWKHKNA